MFTNSTYAGYNAISSTLPLPAESGDDNEPIQSRSKPKNVVPVDIIKLVQHCDEDGAFSVYGLEVGMVRILGLVLDIEETETRITYRIEDRTATITAVRYIEPEDESARRLQINRGEHIAVVGSLKFGPSDKSLVVLKMWKVQGREEIDFHQLSTVYIPLKLSRLHEQRIVIAQSQFTGNVSLMDPRMRGIVPSQAKPFSTPRSSIGGGRQGADYSSFSTQQQDQEFPVTGARVVLRLIRSCYTELGISRKELEQTGNLALTQLTAALDFLLQEGHIYCTQDDFHFKSTDA